MGLNIQLMARYSDSVEINQTWSARQEKYAALAALAAETNAPGNEVFDGLDTAVARRQVLGSLEQFNAALAAARNDIAKLASAEYAPLLATFVLIDASMTEMHGVAKNIFGHLDAGDTASAGRRMATMDRTFGKLNANIAHLSAQVRNIQHETFNEQLRLAQEMRRVEYGIFLLVSLMVVGALYYGRRIVTEIKKSTIEQESKRDEILRLNASLGGSERRVRALLDNVQEGIVSISETGMIEMFNPSAERLFGYRSEEVIGKNISMLMPEPYHSEHDGYLARYLHTGQAHIIGIGREVTGRRSDGSVFPMDLAVSEFALDGRRQFIGSIRDITERKQVQEKLRQSSEKLEERAEQLALTSKYKSEFLSNMSHELRTPLNSLLILSQLLAENDEHNLSEKQVKYAKTIHESGKDLLALINDILDLSKIESGTVTLDLDDVSFANVHESVERTFRHVAQSRGLGFSVELAPDLPPSLYTDAQRLQQVLKNLLSNAFKFTQKGQVLVRIAPVESGWSVDHAGLNSAQAVIGFHVTDTGIGLPADKQKIIFEAFQQADTGTARKYGGTGLGLSISRELAWLLGGELRLVESEIGKGSTFVLYLPLRAPKSGQG